MTHIVRLLSVSALLPLMIALATPAVAETGFERAHPSGVGSYLAGQQAMRDLRTSDAARFFHDAEQLESGNVIVVERSFTAYLTDGDIENAVQLAPHLLDLAPDNQLAKLVLATADVKARRYGAAIAELKGLGTSNFASITGGILKAWALTGNNQRAAAFAELDKLASTGLGDFLVFHRALMADVAGDTADAITLAGKAYNASPNSPRSVEAYIRVLGNAGKFDQAIAVVNKYQAAGGADPIIEEVAKALHKRQAPGMFATNVQSGAAEMYHGVAVALASDRSNILAITFLRLGAYLDPHDQLIRLQLGEMLDSAGQHDEANTFYNNVPASSPLKLSAKLHIAQNYSAMGNPDEAIRQLDLIVSQYPDSLNAMTLLGQMLRINKQYDKAVDIDTKALALTGGNQPADWGIYYQRGISYERSNRWDKAQADFLKALELNPNQPDVLNYLGYTWVDKGENLDRALAMIQKAVRARPSDGFIIDSLGWAFYKLGRLDDAVKTLEKAVQLKPNDPAINNHLGDAYWKVGRKLEAHFQWSIASSLDTDGTLKAEIATKQANGLGPTISTQ